MRETSARSKAGSRGASKVLQATPRNLAFIRRAMKSHVGGLKPCLVKLVVDTEESNRTNRLKGLFLVYEGQSSEGSLGDPQ